MYLPSLTDRELAHHADITFDPLTATELQVELAKRFSANLDAYEAEKALSDKCTEYGVGSAVALANQLDKANALDERANGIALLDLLREHDIDDPAELKKLLDRDAQLTDVLDSLAEPLATLQALATPA